MKIPEQKIYFPDAAEILGMPYSTVYNSVRDKKIAAPSGRQGKKWYWTKSDFLEKVVKPREEEKYNIDQVAEKMHVSRQTIDNRIKSGLYPEPSIQIGKRKWFTFNQYFWITDSE